MTDINRLRMIMGDDTHMIRSNPRREIPRSGTIARRSFFVDNDAFITRRMRVVEFNPIPRPTYSASTSAGFNSFTNKWING